MDAIHALSDYYLITEFLLRILQSRPRALM
jgi:hypothetical protein